MGITITIGLTTLPILEEKQKIEKELEMLESAIDELYDEITEENIDELERYVEKFELEDVHHLMEILSLYYEGNESVKKELLSEYKGIDEIEIDGFAQYNEMLKKYVGLSKKSNILKNAIDECFNLPFNDYAWISSVINDVVGGFGGDEVILNKNDIKQVIEMIEKVKGWKDGDDTRMLDENIKNSVIGKFSEIFAAMDSDDEIICFAKIS